MSSMISVQEAKSIVTKSVDPLDPRQVQLNQASGMTLAEDILSPIDVPGFDQSNMDGYAIRFEDYRSGDLLSIGPVIQAGSTDDFSLVKGQAARIFTGSAIPGNANTVVMQEKTKVDEQGLLNIEDPGLESGTNVRKKGTDIRAGEKALAKGSLLTPAAIGFLASIGISAVKVYPNPSVVILITGKEIKKPGESLQRGQLYDSNSYILTSVLEQLHITEVSIRWIDDDLEELSKELDQAISNFDLVLLTGGVSVGDFDFVGKAAMLTGVEELFHKVKQRPGKPLFFGKKGGKIIFGLPGNPSSVLTCFYEYVTHAIEQMTKKKKLMTVERLPLAKAIQKKKGLTQFLKGNCENGVVSALEAQESFRLSSFATANCLIRFEEDQELLAAGDMVEVHLLSING